MAATARVIWLYACVRYWPDRGVRVCHLLLSDILEPILLLWALISIPLVELFLLEIILKHYVLPAHSPANVCNLVIKRKNIIKSMKKASLAMSELNYRLFRILKL